MKKNSVLRLKTGQFNFKDTIFSHGWIFLEPYYWDNKSESLGLILKLKKLNMKLNKNRKTIFRMNRSRPIMQVSWME